MERCPTCQARLRDATVCPRCRTDLTRLLALQARAESWRQRAVAHLARGEQARAEEAVAMSLRLKRAPLAILLQGFLRRRTESAAKTQPVERLQPEAAETVQPEPVSMTQAEPPGIVEKDNGQLVDTAAEAETKTIPPQDIHELPAENLGQVNRFIHKLMDIFHPRRQGL